MSKIKEIKHKCYVLKQYLCDDKPLSDELLDFALDITGAESEEKTINSLINNLKKERILKDDYEGHLMVDVMIPHYIISMINTYGNE